MRGFTDCHDRHARLIGEAAHRRDQLRVAGRFAHGMKKVIRGGVLIPVTTEMQPDTPLESFRAEITLEHRQDLRTLLVGDRIERARDLRVLRDHLPDRTAAPERVVAHGVECIVQFTRCNAEIGPPLVGHLLAHPFGKALVQPDVGPPCRRDEIAEPLVRHLVRADLREGAQLPERGIGIEQYQGILENDESGVLHGAALDRRCQEVQLFVGVSAAEIGLEPGQQLRRFDRRKLHADFLSLGGNDPEGQRLCTQRIRGHLRLDDIERSDADRDEVGRQRLGGRKSMDDLRTVLEAADLRCVRKHLRALRRSHGHVEWSLETRLIETREHASRVDRLHLSPGVPPATHLGAVKTLTTRAKGGRIIDLQRDWPSGQLARQVEPHHAGVVDLGIARGQRRASSSDPRLADLQIPPVHE